MRACRHCKKEFKARVGLGLCRVCWNDQQIKAQYEPIAPFGGAEAAHLQKARAMSEEVLISRIKADGGTQTRVENDPATVGEYADFLAGGGTMPDVVVFNDGTWLWMADGFQRLAAHVRVGRRKINAHVKNGTRLDALLYSAGSNATHGKKRTNEDKRNAIKMVLAEDKWVGSSDRWVSEKCRVDHKTVASVRHEMFGGEIPTLENYVPNGAENEEKNEHISTPESTVVNGDNFGQASRPEPTAGTPEDGVSDQKVGPRQDAEPVVGVEGPEEVGQEELPVEMEREPGIDPPEEEPATELATPDPPKATNGRAVQPLLMEKDMEKALKVFDALVITCRDVCESDEHRKPAYQALRKTLQFLWEDWNALRRGRPPQVARAVLQREGVEGLAREVRSFLHSEDEHDAHPSAQAKQIRNDFRRRVTKMVAEILNPKTKDLFS